MKAMAIDLPKTKQTNNIISKNDNSKNNKNINFLDLLLKDVKTKEKNNLISKNDNSNNEKNDLTKELQELLKDLLLNKDENINNIPNINAILNKINFNQDIVKEVKNIIKSNLKQQNILLTKSEINNFKKIDNVTDLVKFANKKELNIKKITFQIAKELKENPQLIDDIKNTLKNNIKQASKISTSEIISTKKEIKTNTKIIIQNKNNIQINQENNKHITIKNILQNNKKTDTKLNQQAIDKKVKLDNNNLNTNSKLNTSANKAKLNEQTIDKKVKLDNDNLNTDTKLNTSANKISQNNQIIDTEVKLNNHNIQTHNSTNKEHINLSSLLNNNVSEKVKKTISHNSEKNPIEINTQINPNMNINEIKAKQVLAKETINHFKNNLDEAIKNYKPPISKVNIELNPKNLGKVEVSIIQRGNNITLHMNSDQNNIVLFQNHQAEFRQALTNIGFSNIDMNFNSNQEREKRQNQAKKSYKNNAEDMDISDIEIEAKYQYA